MTLRWMVFLSMLLPGCGGDRDHLLGGNDEFGAGRLSILYVDADTVYVGYDRVDPFGQEIADGPMPGIYAQPTAGGPPVVVTEFSERLQDRKVVGDEFHLLVSEETELRVIRVGLDGSDRSEEIVPSPQVPQELPERERSYLAFDGTYWYVIISDGELIRLATQGEPMMALAEVAGVYSHLHAADGMLYWRGDGSGDSVFRLVADGSESTPVILVEPDRPNPSDCDAQSAWLLGVAAGMPVLAENVFRCEYTQETDYTFYEDQTIYTVADDSSGSVAMANFEWAHYPVQLGNGGVVGVDADGHGVEIDPASGATLRRSGPLALPFEAYSLFFTDEYIFYLRQDDDNRTHVHAKPIDW